jgi:hypothetical protein
MIKLKLKPLISPPNKQTFKSVDFSLPPKKTYKVQTGDVINQFINNNVKDVRIKTCKNTIRKKTRNINVQNETDLFTL